MQVQFVAIGYENADTCHRLTTQHKRRALVSRRTCASEILGRVAFGTQMNNREMRQVDLLCMGLAGGVKLMYIREGQ